MTLKNNYNTGETLAAADWNKAANVSNDNFIPKWLKYPDAVYSADELLAIKALKKLSVELPDSLNGQQFIVQYVTNLPLIASASDFRFSVQIKHATDSLYYHLTKTLSGIPSSPISSTFGNGMLATNNAAGTEINFYLEVDWSVLPNNFEGFVNIPINTGVLYGIHSLTKQLIA